MPHCTLSSHIHIPNPTPHLFHIFQAPCSYHVTPLTLLSEFHLPPHTHAKAICITVPHYVISADLELMLFFKEHPEGDDGAVDQYTADDGHHGCVPEDDSGVGEENWEGNPHQHQKPRTESPEIHNRIPRTLNEIIRIGASSTDPVGQGSEHVGCNDEEGQVLVEEGASERFSTTFFASDTFFAVWVGYRGE